MNSEGTATPAAPDSAAKESAAKASAAEDSVENTTESAVPALICANCNTPLQGGFCHVCGQENTNPIRNMLSLIHEFFGEMGNWDGRFWRTIWPLLTKPAFFKS